MCDYRYPDKSITVINGNVAYKFCERASTFWVQSLTSTHNMLTCSHHLARIVREIDHAAAQFDISTIERKPDMRYARRSQSGAHMKMTNETTNYARVTVKPYTPRTQNGH
jgi:hypothetical protein